MHLGTHHASIILLKLPPKNISPQNSTGHTSATNIWDRVNP